MFAALTGWYTGCERNRRRYPRIKRDFDVEYTLDGERWDFAEGVDLSGGGMCIVSYRAIPRDVFDARIGIVYEKNQRMHQFTVRSSVNGYGSPKRFTSRILVNDDDSEVVFLS